LGLPDSLGRGTDPAWIRIRLQVRLQILPFSFKCV
jgi:hypothetical protein